MKLEYPYQNFYKLLRSNVLKKPNKKIIFIGNEKITNLMFIQKVDAFARFLEISGVKKSDKIAIIAPNSLEFIITVFAVSKLAGVSVPINNLLKAAEYEFILDDCEAKILVTSNKFMKEVKYLNSTCKALEKTVWVDSCESINDSNIIFDEVLDTHPHKEEKYVEAQLDDLAIIFYTSGTTGKPKGAMMSNRNIFSNMIAGSERFNINEKDRFIVYLPMFHSFTFSTMLMMPFISIASMVIVPNILPFSNIIKQTLLKRVTVFLGVPDIYNALIRAKLPWYFLWFNSLRLFISGGSALSEDTLNKFNAKFSRAKMIEGYGLSECSPVVCVNTLQKQKVLSVGLAFGDYELKVVDEEMLEVPRGQVGELIVKGDCVMLGYLNMPEATESTILNGWLKTGDMAKMDEENYIYIVDRIKDLIISKGVNIYPRQIEEELMQISCIKAAAVVGMLDSNSGEIPVAFVELEDDADTSTCTQSYVKKELKKTLANFKIPKSVTFVEALPKTATGKVLKRVLKEEILEGKY